MPTTVWIEILKLGAQFVGALVIARIAVSWALRRYKSEKVWERRLGAYVEALASLGEMRLVVGRWHDELIMARELPEGQGATQRDRYQAARRRLEEGVATAALLLPSPSAAVLAGLDRELEKSRKGQDQVDDLDAQYAVLDRTIIELTAQGRQELGTEFRKRVAQSGSSPRA